MGVYSSLRLQCQCSGTVEFQLGGGCETYYNIQDVPKPLVAALDGQSAKCDICQQEVEIKTHVIPEVHWEHPPG